MSNKRRRSSFLLADEEPDLHILVADAPGPFSAHAGVLRLFSVCVRDLARADAGLTPWDRRRLVLEGEAAPVAAGVVRQWLDFIYGHVDSARQLRPFCSLNDAKPLVLFADAADTCNAAILELCDMLVNNAARVRLEVPLRRGAAAAAAPLLPFTVEIRLKVRLYRSNAADGLTYIGMDAPDQIAREVTVDRHLFAPRRGEFAAALRSLLESWLYLAGRMRMVPLVRVLLDFVKTQLLCGTEAVLGGADAGDVFSARMRATRAPARGLHARRAPVPTQRTAAAGRRRRRRGACGAGADAGGDGGDKAGGRAAAQRRGGGVCAAAERLPVAAGDGHASGQKRTGGGDQRVRGRLERGAMRGGGARGDGEGDGRRRQQRRRRGAAVKNAPETSCKISSVVAGIGAVRKLRWALSHHALFVWGTAWYGTRR